MEYTHLIVGLVLIGLGFLVRAFPMLIAGYNTSTESQKNEMKKAGLPKAVRNGLIAIGLFLIIGYYSFTWFGYYKIAEFVPTVIIFLGVFVLFIYCLKFRPKKD